MFKQNLEGPFDFMESELETAITKTSPGVFVLGYQGPTTFYPYFIGRSDSDVKTALKPHLLKPFAMFVFGYAKNAKAAFEWECNLFHNYLPPDHPPHPKPSEGEKWKCPRCRELG